jgi:hypothetical protein
MDLTLHIFSIPIHQYFFFAHATVKFPYFQLNQYVWDLQMSWAHLIPYAPHHIPHLHTAYYL